jgi:hypothetical protein
MAPRDALALFLDDPLRPGVPRTVAPGQPADLCLLAAPLDQALGRLPDVEVACTVRAGRVVWAGAAALRG